MDLSGLFAPAWGRPNLEHARDLTLALVDSALTEAKVPYSLAFGTLLGHERHNKQGIPWDDDMDIMLPYGQRDAAVSALRGAGLKVSPHVNGVSGFGKVWLPAAQGSVYILRAKHRYPFIDLFWYDETQTEDKGLVFSDKETTCNIAGVNPSAFTFHRSTLNGVPTWVVGQPQALLDKWYSTGWRTQAVPSVHSHRLEHTRMLDKAQVKEYPLQDALAANRRATRPYAIPPTMVAAFAVPASVAFVVGVILLAVAAAGKARTVKPTEWLVFNVVGSFLVVAGLVVFAIGAYEWGCVSGLW